MIWHLLSIGIEHLWLLAQLSSLKGGSQQGYGGPLCKSVTAPDNPPAAGNTTRPLTAPDDGPTAANNTLPVTWQQTTLPRSKRHSRRVVRAMMARYYRRWRALCTVLQRNTDFLDLSKLTFQHRVKLQEQASASILQVSAENVSWTRQGYPCHSLREHIGTLALSVVSSKDAREGTKNTSHWQLWQYISLTFDVHLRELSSFGAW